MGESWVKGRNFRVRVWAWVLVEKWGSWRNWELGFVEGREDSQWRRWKGFFEEFLKE